jgi:hypothetical protein
MIEFIDFDGCLIEVYEDNVLTKFPSGHSVAGAVNKDGSQDELAQQLGYQSTWDMVREHEILHTWLAIKLGFPHSPTLWDVALNLLEIPNRPALIIWPGEEAAVIEFQRWLNGGVPNWDYLNCFVEKGLNMTNLYSEAMKLLR